MAWHVGTVPVARHGGLEAALRFGLSRPMHTAHGPPTNTDRALVLAGRVAHLLAAGSLKHSLASLRS